MTTNRARAQRILESMTNRWGKPATARAAAQALADAGLLAPDLPPVTVDDFDARNRSVNTEEEA